MELCSDTYADTPMAYADTPMAYADVEIMAVQLIHQLHQLEARGYTILFWEPSAITVTKKTGQIRYSLNDTAHYVPLHTKDTSQLFLICPAVFPLPAEKCAPELLHIPALPFLTHRSASYYSLALLCLAQLHLSLAELTGTKLFYFLERCLKSDPRERLPLALL